MMETLGRLKYLLFATCVIWLSALLAWVTNDIEFVHGVAVILALISTMTIWSLWVLNEYGIGTEGTPHEKPKRATGEDARLGLMLSLLTPDERDALRSRLAGELDADGEAVSLADLLVEQGPTNTSSRHTP